MLTLQKNLLENLLVICTAFSTILTMMVLLILLTTQNAQATDSRYRPGFMPNGSYRDIKFEVRQTFSNAPISKALIRCNSTDGRLEGLTDRYGFGKITIQHWSRYKFQRQTMECRVSRSGHSTRTVRVPIGNNISSREIDVSLTRR